jgi:Uma2 family endonuclease
MGEGVDQGEIIRIVLSSLGELATQQGWQNVFLAGDNFFAWVREHPLVRVSPDVYLLDDPPPLPRPKMWQTWLPGHRPPRWALEIVSEEWKKDYNDAPLKYGQLGTKELVIFDPEAAVGGARRAPRAPLTVYRRDDDGAFIRVYAGPGPVRSDELGAYLVVARDGAAARLRIARDPAGEQLVPTAEEAKQAAEQAKQAAEQAKQVAEQAKQAAEQAKQAAEDRVLLLEAELAKLRGGK